MGTVYRVFVPRFKSVNVPKFGKCPILDEEGNHLSGNMLVRTTESMSVCDGITYLSCVAECESPVSASDYVHFILTDDVMARGVGVKDNVERASIKHVIDEESGNVVSCPLHKQVAFPIFIVEGESGDDVEESGINIRDIVLIAAYGLSEDGNTEFTKRQMDVSVGHLNFIFLTSSWKGLTRDMSEVRYFLENSKMKPAIISLLSEEFLRYLMGVMVVTPVSIGYKVSVAHAITTSSLKNYDGVSLDSVVLPYGAKALGETFYGLPIYTLPVQERQFGLPYFETPTAERGSDEFVVCKFCVSTTRATLLNATEQYLKENFKLLVSDRSAADSKFVRFLTGQFHSMMDEGLAETVMSESNSSLMSNFFSIDSVVHTVPEISNWVYWGDYGDSSILANTIYRIGYEHQTVLHTRV